MFSVLTIKKRNQLVPGTIRAKRQSDRRQAVDSIESEEDIVMLGYLSITQPCDAFYPHLELVNKHGNRVQLIVLALSVHDVGLRSA